MRVMRRPVFRRRKMTRVMEGNSRAWRQVTYWNYPTFPIVKVVKRSVLRVLELRVRP